MTYGRPVGVTAGHGWTLPYSTAKRNAPERPVSAPFLTSPTAGDYTRVHPTSTTATAPPPALGLRETWRSSDGAAGRPERPANSRLACGVGLRRP
jgi:hypothetical protein